MNRVQQQPAFILHPRSYRESSLILEVLTRDHGRAAMVARGAKRPKSRLRNLLQPFRPLLIGWSARGELGTLTTAEQVAAPPGLHGESLYCGLYVNELLMRLLHRGDPHPEVFERYRGVLASLASGESPQPVLRLFEKHLLEAIGYGLILDHEFKTNRPITDEAWYDYRPDRGAVRIGEGQGDKKRLISGASLRALKEENIGSAAQGELRRLMRRVIAHHLGDKPLASQALFVGPGK